MAFQINSNVIINDSRELIGVNTAGINTSLFVGENITATASSGEVDLAGLSFSGGDVYTGVTTDISGGLPANDLLASALGIREYVDSQVGAANQLNFVGNTGEEGDIDLANEVLGLFGDTNQIVVGVATAAGNDATFALSPTLELPGTLAFGSGGQAVNTIGISTALNQEGTGASNEVIPTELAVRDFVAGEIATIGGGELDFQGDTGGVLPITLATEVFGIFGTSLEVETVGAGNSITIGLPDDVTVANDLTVTNDLTVSNDLSVTANATVSGLTSLDDLAVGGASTTTGIADFNGRVNLNAGADLTAGQTLGIQTNTGTLQPIRFVGVNTGLIENGTAADNVLPTERAVKLYVDSQIQETGGSLNVAGDTGTGSIDLSSQTFSIFGTSLEVETVGAGQSITIGLPDDVTISGALDVIGDTSLGGNLTGDGASEISGITTANLGAGVVATNFYGSGEFLTDISAGDVTLADQQAAGTYYIPFAANATGAEALFTDAAQLTYDPSTGLLTAQDVNTLSDIRYKDNVETIDNALGKVEELRGVTFDWKHTEGSSVGVIAQEVQAVLPQLVTEGEDKITVNYNGLVGLLLQAVKELSEEVEDLKRHVQ